MKKARHKKYRPRAIKIPMHAETRDSLALEIHMAILALTQAPSEESYNSFSKMLGTLRDAGMDDPFMAPACEVMARIYKRWEAIGSITLEPSEAEALITVGAAIDAALPKLNMVSFHQAVAQMTLFCMDLASAAQGEAE